MADLQREEHCICCVMTLQQLDQDFQDRTSTVLLVLLQINKTLHTHTHTQGQLSAFMLLL